MSKQRRTVLSGVVTPLRTVTPEPAAESQVETAAKPARRASGTKATTIQQAVYLPPAVHDQLRELAFAERVKMHGLLMEGLDAVFRNRGMKSIAELTGKEQ